MQQINIGGQLIDVPTSYRIVKKGQPIVKNDKYLDWDSKEFITVSAADCTTNVADIPDVIIRSVEDITDDTVFESDTDLVITIDVAMIL